MSEVTAVVIGSSREWASALARSQVDGVVTSPSLGQVRDTAGGLRTPLLWLIESRAAPSEDTLPALLDHAPDPAVSLPVDQLDRPIDALLGRVAYADVPALLEAVARRRVPLRHTHVISLLVEREIVLDLSPPDPRRLGLYAGSEWTGRLFDRRRGVLVPRSRIRVATPPSGSPLHALRMTRTGTWRNGEALRQIHRSVTGRPP